jgi:hypothetical protein
MAHFKPGWGTLLGKALNLPQDGGTHRQSIQKRSSGRAPCIAPSLNGGIVPVFQPAVIVLNLHFPVAIGDRPLRRDLQGRTGESNDRQASG